MRLFLAILCLVLACLVCSESSAQCASGARQLPGTRLVQGLTIARAEYRAEARREARRERRVRILPRR